MNQEISDRVESVVISRLASDSALAHTVEIASIEGQMVRLHLSLPLGSEPNNSTATTLNALALRVISRLSLVRESDLWCSMAGCNMLPLQASDSGGVVLPLEVNFTLAQESDNDAA